MSAEPDPATARASAVREQAPLPSQAPLGPRPNHVEARTLAAVAARLHLPTEHLRPEALPTGGADTASVVPATAVTGVTLASSRVRPGDLFAALPGARGHGVDFAAQAVAAGAVAVLTDPDGAARLAAAVAAGAVGDRPVLVVEDPRRRLGALASWVYGDPCDVVDVVAVTGTSGKTSVTYLLEAGLVGAGRPAGVVGTTGTRVAGRPVASALTTPEAPDLHALLAVMVEQGVTDAAVEVSSHALVLGRVDGLRARVALFTNLGRDHLDLHGTMAAYLDAKATLFTPGHTAAAVVCLDGGLPPDDGAGVAIARRAVAAGVDVTTLAVRPGSAATRVADWVVTAAQADGRGSRFTLRGPDGVAHEVRIALPGDFQVANAALAVVGLAVAGHNLEAVIDGVSRCRAVPGRLERVEAGQAFLALVDYAHKPPALQTVLTALTPAAGGRLIVVLGAGGDRDRGKRPLMGAVAALAADVVVVTDDNPRSEDPAEIRAAVLAGARDALADAPERAVALLEIADRGAAIAAAVGLAGDDDIVVVAGKGHETGQERAGVVEPFDDRLVLAGHLAARLAAVGSAAASGSGR